MIILSREQRLCFSLLGRGLMGVKTSKRNKAPHREREPTRQIHLNRDTLSSCLVAGQGEGAGGVPSPCDSQPMVLHHHCGIRLCGIRAWVDVRHFIVKGVEELSWKRKRSLCQPLAMTMGNVASGLSGLMQKLNS